MFCWLPLIIILCLCSIVVFFFFYKIIIHFKFLKCFRTATLHYFYDYFYGYSVNWMISKMHCLYARKNLHAYLYDFSLYYRSIEPHTILFHIFFCCSCCCLPLLMPNNMRTLSHVYVYCIRVRIQKKHTPTMMIKWTINITVYQNIFYRVEIGNLDNYYEGAWIVFTICYYCFYYTF